MSTKLVTIVAFAISSGAAMAAPLLYDVEFRVENLGSPVDFIEGSFSFVADPSLMTNIDNIDPLSLDIGTAIDRYGPADSQVDYWQSMGTPWGFLVGRVMPTGNDQNNRVSTSRPGDYVLVFQFRPDFTFVRANGVVVYPTSFGMGAFLDVNTDQGLGTVSRWSVNATPSSSGGAVPEPAAWALMIAGFGLVGGAARRRRAAAVVG